MIVRKPTVYTLFAWLKCSGLFIDSVCTVEIDMSYVIELTISMLTLLECTTLCRVLLVCLVAADSQHCSLCPLISISWVLVYCCV